MPRDKQPNPEPDILDKIFGDPSDLGEDELDMLINALSPGTDPSSSIRSIANAAAVKYRIQNKLPPDHIQAALEATSEITGLDNAPISKLCQILDAIKPPFTGAITDPAYAYRNREGDLDNEDQAIVDDLTDELQKDWDDEDPEK